jgi:flagellar hook assembly protein FlgD
VKTVLTSQDEATQIRMNLDAPSQVSVNVQTLKKKVIRQIVNARFDAGDHIFLWDGRDDNNALVTAGIYELIISVNGTVKARQNITVSR